MANTTGPRWGDLDESSEDTNSYDTDQEDSIPHTGFVDHDNESFASLSRTKGEGESWSSDNEDLLDGCADEDQNDNNNSSDSDDEADFAAWVGNLKYLNHSHYAHIFQRVVVDWSRSRCPSSFCRTVSVSDSDDASALADTALHSLARKGRIIEGDDMYMHYCPEALDEILLLLPDGLRQRDNIGETPLHVALSHRNDEIAKLLLSRLRSKRSKRRQKMGQEVVATQNKYGCTPLHHAVRYGAAPSVLCEVVSLFPEAAAMQNQFGQTPLHEAVRQGNYRAAKAVLSHLNKKKRREVICQKDKNHSNTALHFAGFDEHSHIFLDLIARCREAAAIQNSYGSTPLHRFAASRRHNGMKYLIKALRLLTPTPEVVLARRPNDGWTALHTMCERLNIDFSDGAEKTLCAFHDVAPDIGLVKDRTGNTALHVALASTEHYRRYSRVDELVEAYLTTWPKAALVANADGNTPLHLACMQVGLPTKNIITHLLRVSSKVVFMTNKSGLTPLHVLCSVEIADFGYAYSPPTLPAYTSDLLMVCLEAATTGIIEKGKCSRYICTVSNIGEVQDAALGNTPLHYVVSSAKDYFNVSSIGVYINAWPKAPSMANKDGNTPLHLACLHCARQCPRLISLLLRAFPGAASQVNRYGQTPLHAVCSVQSMRKRRTLPLPSTVALLLEANPEALAHPDEAGNTPLHCAFINGADCAAKGLLLRSGKEAIFVENDNGQTVLHCACMAKINTKFLPLLLEAYPDAMGISDRNGDTPLHYALQCKGLASAKIILIKAGKEALCWANEKGQLPLHIACMRRSPLDFFDLLLQASPDSAVAVDKEWNTPAHLAFLYHLPFDVKRRILEVGSGAVSIANRSGETPLSMPSTVNELFRLLQAIPFLVRPD